MWHAITTNAVLRKLVDMLSAEARDVPSLGRHHDAGWNQPPALLRLVRRDVTSQLVVQRSACRITQHDALLENAPEELGSHATSTHLQAVAIRHRPRDGDADNGCNHSESTAGWFNTEVISRGAAPRKESIGLPWRVGMFLGYELKMTRRCRSSTYNGTSTKTAPRLQNPYV